MYLLVTDKSKHELKMSNGRTGTNTVSHLNKVRHDTIRFVRHEQCEPKI